MRPTVALLLVGFAAACTPMTWVKPDAGPEQLRQDAAVCRDEAWREARYRSWMYRPLTPTLLRDPLSRHYVFAPYAPFSDPFGDDFMEESRLYDFCMRAKGYRLEPAETKKG